MMMSFFRSEHDLRSTCDDARNAHCGRCFATKHGTTGTSRRNHAAAAIHIRTTRNTQTRALAASSAAAAVDMSDAR